MGDVYRFGGHRLDPSGHELLGPDGPVEMEPRTFDVLCYLVEHADRVVPKEELLEQVWGDQFVGDSALSTRVKHARAAVGDDGRSQRVIKTVHRVGYRFVGDVTVRGRPSVRTPETTGDPGGLPAVDSGAAGAAGAVEPADALDGTGLVGRAEELRRLLGRLEQHRVVTLTGPGGVGKTSLADLALRRSPFAGTMCQLANTRDPDAIANVVLGAIGEGQQRDADPAESLARVLEDRTDLLLLDNCEHVLAGARSLVEQLTARCPELRILATSRVALGLPGESVLPIEPLSTEDAVRCFTERARQVGEEIGNDDPSVTELCERLDCLPLALELAAVRTRILSPAKMLDLLTDRFRLLRRSEGDDDRHSSLVATIEWSWDDLSEADAALLADLAVFVGQFSLEDAASVALDGGDPLDAIDGLERLVARSLVVPVRVPGGQTHFRLLESVRDFAQDRQRDPASLRLAHALHFARRAEEADELCQTEAVDTALAEVTEMWDNLRAAAGYAGDAGRPEVVRRILAAVAEYTDLFGVYEVLDWCAAADLDDDLAQAEDTALAAAALATRARTLAHQGRLEVAGPLAEEALALHESHATLLATVWCAYYGGDLDAVVEAAPRLAELSRSGRGMDRAYAQGFEAIATAIRQEVDLSTPTVDDAAVDRGVLGVLDTMTDGLRLCTVDPDTAARLLERVVETSMERDYRLLLGAAASTLTQITLPAKQPQEAVEVLRRTLARYRERNMWNLIAADIPMAARLLADAGDVDTAARLLGARQASGYAAGLSEVLAVMLRDDLAAAHGERFEGGFVAGTHLRPPAAADLAMEAMAHVTTG